MNGSQALSLLLKGATLTATFKTYRKDPKAPHHLQGNFTMDAGMNPVPFNVPQMEKAVLAFDGEEFPIEYVHLSFLAVRGLVEAQIVDDDTICYRLTEAGRKEAKK